MTDIEKIQALIEKYTTHCSTHPVLSNVWIDTLEMCKKRLVSIHKMIDQAEELVDKIPNQVNDININTIVTVLSVLSHRESTQEAAQEAALQ